MRVLHVGPKTYPPAHGGVEKVVFDVVNGIKRHISFILVEWKQKETSNIKVLPKGFINQVKYILLFIKENKIDLINFHKEGFVPHAILVSILKNKTVVTIHGCAWRIKRWSWYYRLMFYVLDIFACIFVSKVVFVGKEDYRHFSKIVFWKKHIYIPNGIESFDLEGSNDINECVYIGRISPEKNILKLIKMFNGENKRLTIYGPFDKHDVGYKNKVMTEIEGNKHVEYAGVLKYTEIISTLSKYNTFCNISFSEGMPVSVLEASSVGLNLILSNIPQHVDLKFPDAYYVEASNPILNDCHFNSISLRNKKHVQKYFSIDKTVESYQNIYEQLN